MECLRGHVSRRLRLESRKASAFRTHGRTRPDGLLFQGRAERLLSLAPTTKAIQPKVDSPCESTVTFTGSTAHYMAGELGSMQMLRQSLDFPGRDMQTRHRHSWYARQVYK